MLAQYRVTGGEGTPIMAYEDKSDSQLDIYLLNGMSNAEISFTSTNDVTHQWYKYKDRAANAVAIPSQQFGRTSTIIDVEEGYGYFVSNAVNAYYVWIVDYSKYVPRFNSLYIDTGAETDACHELYLRADADVEDIYYNTPINGTRRKLSREYNVSYSTQSWNGGSRSFHAIDTVVKIKDNIGGFRIPSPLIDTEFTLSGDQFATDFGLTQKISTPLYQAIAVAVKVDTVIYREKSDNQIKKDTEQIGEDDLGGSGPVDITFTAIGNTPVAAFFKWTIVLTPYNQSSRLVVDYVGTSLHYVFKEPGIYKVKVEASDRTPVCTDSVNYTVTIFISELDVPNAFSPLSSPGVNDEFKVAYKSLSKFKAWIFNKWGTQLFFWTDPSKGWDGKYKGKFVPTGVYYYVIEAEGTDGQKIKKAGDINILR